MLNDNFVELQEPQEPLKSSLVSRNITILGKRTSVRLEPEMWNAVKDIAKRERCTIHDVCSLISLRKRENTSLTAAIRVFIMLYYRASSTEEGHQRAGHGSFETMKTRARVLSKRDTRYFYRASPADILFCQPNAAQMETDGAV
jgi:predicted DNA-binding ribbon-helix-helix protein